MALFSIFVAAADNGVIGDSVNNHLWTVKADTRHFFRKTKGHTVIMGRKTLESMGKPLPKRTNIVITRNPEYSADDCVVVHSIEEAMRAADNGDESQEVMVIGDGEIYRQAMPYVDKIYLTRVHLSPKGDVKFEFDSSQWIETSREEHGPDDENECAYDFIELRRKPAVRG